jgi:hypothetical protein
MSNFKSTSNFKSNNRDQNINKERATTSRFDVLNESNVGENNNSRSRDNYRNPERDNNRYNNRRQNFNQYIDTRDKPKPPRLPTDADFPVFGEVSEINIPVVTDAAAKEEVDDNISKTPSYIGVVKHEEEVIRPENNDDIKPGWVELRRGSKGELLYRYGPKIHNKYNFDDIDFEAYEQQRLYQEWIDKYEQDKIDFIELYGIEEYAKIAYVPVYDDSYNDEEEDENEEDDYNDSDY